MDTGDPGGGGDAPEASPADPFGEGPRVPVAAEQDTDNDGWIAAKDCDDRDPEAFPGAPETAYDGRDQDCDGYDLIDVDGDGQAAEVAGGTDCNDAEPGTRAGAVEVCNLHDDDCDGENDEGCPTAEPAPLDPGGVWWVCGTASGGGPWWLVAIWLLTGRRRATALRG